MLSEWWTRRAGNSQANRFSFSISHNFLRLSVLQCFSSFLNQIFDFFASLFKGHTHTHTAGQKKIKNRQKYDLAFGRQKKDLPDFIINRWDVWECSTFLCCCTKFKGENHFKRSELNRNWLNNSLQVKAGRDQSVNHIEKEEKEEEEEKHAGQIASRKYKVCQNKWRISTRQIEKKIKFCLTLFEAMNLLSFQNKKDLYEIRAASLFQTGRSDS